MEAALHMAWRQLSLDMFVEAPNFVTGLLHLYSNFLCWVYIETFEQEALATSEHTPGRWQRYVDHIHTRLKKAQAQAFTDHLNLVDKNIKSTTEGEVTTEVSVEEEEEVGVRKGWVFAFYGKGGWNY